MYRRQCDTECQLKWCYRMVMDWPGWLYISGTKPEWCNSSRYLFTYGEQHRQWLQPRYCVHNIIDSKCGTIIKWCN
jgi:hypothetical protein